MAVESDQIIVVGCVLKHWMVQWNNLFSSKKRCSHNCDIFCRFCSHKGATILNRKGGKVLFSGAISFFQGAFFFNFSPVYYMSNWGPFKGPKVHWFSASFWGTAAPKRAGNDSDDTSGAIADPAGRWVLCRVVLEFPWLSQLKVSIQWTCFLGEENQFQWFK